MALNKEDKKDVKNHLGKALANKVSDATRDHSGKMQKGGSSFKKVWNSPEVKGARANNKALKAKTGGKGLNSAMNAKPWSEKKDYSGVYHAGSDGKTRMLSTKSAKNKGILS